LHIRPLRVSLVPALDGFFDDFFGSFSIAPDVEVTLIARATDGTGALQSEPFSLAQPDGAGGWNTINVKGAPAG